MKNKIILILVVLIFSAWICKGTSAMGTEPQEKPKEEVQQEQAPQEKTGQKLYEEVGETTEEEVQEQKRPKEGPEVEEGAVKEILERGRLGDFELSPPNK